MPRRHQDTKVHEEDQAGSGFGVQGSGDSWWRESLGHGQHSGCSAPPRRIFGPHTADLRLGVVVSWQKPPPIRTAYRKTNAHPTSRGWEKKVGSRGGRDYNTLRGGMAYCARFR